MIEIETLSPSAPKAHRISVIGEFHQDDARALVDFARQQAEEGGGGNVLIDATSLADFTLSAIGEELIHLPTFVRWTYGLNRIAFVSDEEWMRTAARFESALLPGVAYQVYDEDEVDAARAWVLEQADGPHTEAFHEIDIGKPGIAAFELTGRLDRAESERGIAMVRARLADPDCSRLMIVIKRWHGFDADVLLSDKVIPAKIDLVDKLDRYAVVGGPGWIGNMTGVMGRLVRPEIRAFDLEDQDEAVEWLSE